MAETYDPQKVTAIVNGTRLPPSDFPDDSFIEVSFENEDFTRTRSQGKEGVFNKVPDDSGTISFTVMQQGFARTFLDNITQADRETGLVAVSLSILDPLGGENITARECHLQGRPDRAFGSETETRSYEFIADRIKVSSADPTSFLP